MTTPHFLNSKKTSEMFGVSRTTLKRWRLSGQLIEGVHYHLNGSRSILFNVELLTDWIENRNSPEAHNKVIEAYLKRRDNRLAKVA
jgi:hypothetical protein